MDHNKTAVTAIFDIGTSLKRFQLFDSNLNALSSEEKSIGDPYQVSRGAGEDSLTHESAGRGGGAGVGLGEVAEKDSGVGQGEVARLDSNTDTREAITTWMEECLRSAAANPLYQIVAVNIAAGSDHLPYLSSVLAEMAGRLPGGGDIITGRGVLNTIASLIPYLKDAEKPIILLSTGVNCTFIRSSDPAHHYKRLIEKGREGELLIPEGEEGVSLSFPLGEIHDRNVEMLDERFGVTGELYKTIKIRQKKIGRMEAARRGRVFFGDGVPGGYADHRADLTSFLTYADAYHQMMYDLVDEYLHSFSRLITDPQLPEIIYVTGGFAHNDTFIRILAARLPHKRVYSSTIPNATALGAAMVLYDSVYEGDMPPVYLGLKAILLLDE